MRRLTGGEPTLTTHPLRIECAQYATATPEGDSLNISIPSDIGRRLGDLRTRAQMTQTAVAAQLPADQSRISRIEKGDIVPSESEVRAFLGALSTDDARAYTRYLETDWQVLPRPAPEVPEIDTLWLAEQKLRALNEFERGKNPPAPVRAEIEMHRGSLRQSAEYLTRLGH